MRGGPAVAETRLEVLPPEASTPLWAGATLNERARMRESGQNVRPRAKAVGAPDLSLVMPLFDEADGVEAVVESLTMTLERAGIAYQLVLVDNGSRDGTGELVAEISSRNPRVDVVRLPRNAGYGGGILAGLSVARAPVLGYLWGDQQVGHYAVVELYRRLRAERLDLCKVRRVVRLEGRHRQVLTMAYHAVFPCFFPLPSSDIHGCPKLFTRAVFERIRPSSRDWFLDAEIMIRARELGLRVAEMDVVAYPRPAGASKVRWGTVVEFAVNLLGHRCKKAVGALPFRRGTASRGQERLQDDSAGS